MFKIKDLKKTKILATIGPSSNCRDILKKMFIAGVNAIRCNFSHGSAKDHAESISIVRDLERELNIHITVVADLQGPKIRIARFEKGVIDLKSGDPFVLDPNMNEFLGTKNSVSIDYKDLPKDVKKGDYLLIDDGKIVLKVNNVVLNIIYCEVVSGGKLYNNKGINKKGGGLSVNSLTSKDISDIRIISKLDVDYVAVSFPRSKEDIKLARSLLKKSGSDALIIAKVERTEALLNIEDIVQESDGIMIARGDLAVEIGEENVPAIQKKIIAICKKSCKLVITATQMMESMIKSPVPTRAEVSDLANSILDGTDVVMLSAESAVGMYPVKTIEIMSKVCKSIEGHKSFRYCKQGDIDMEQFLFEKSLLLSSANLANLTNSVHLVLVNRDPRLALFLSKISNNSFYIYFLSSKTKHLKIVSLFSSVIPIFINDYFYNGHKKNIIDILKRYISFKKSDVIIYQKERSIEILIETKNS